MISRPRAARRRAIHLAGRRSSAAACARWRGSAIAPPTSGSAARRSLADHRGREAADLLTRALTRDMAGVQTSILNSPEQNSQAFDPPYEANDLVALAFARYPYPEFFFGWTPESGGHGHVRPHRSAASLDRRARASRRLSRRRPARSAGNRDAARGGSSRTSPSAAAIRYSTRRSEGSATRSSRSSRYTAHHAGTARPRVRRRHQSRRGPATTISTTS